jgi:hypothetical protein
MKETVRKVWTELVKPFVRKVVRKLILAIFKWKLFHDIVSNIQWTTVDSKFKISILQTENCSPKILSYDVIIWEDIRFHQKLKPAAASTTKPATLMPTLLHSLIHHLLRPIIFVCFYFFFFFLSFFATLRFPPITLNVILYATTIVQIQLNEVSIKSLFDLSKWFSDNSFAFIIPPEIQTAIQCRSIAVQTSFAHITLEQLQCITLYECLWYHQNMYYNMLTSLTPIHGHVYELIDIQLSIQRISTQHLSNIFPTALYVFDKKFFAEINRLFGNESILQFDRRRKRSIQKRLRRRKAFNTEDTTHNTTQSIPENMGILIAWMQLFFDQLPDWLSKLQIRIDSIVCSSRLINMKLEATKAFIEFNPDEAHHPSWKEAIPEQDEAIVMQGKLRSLQVTIPNKNGSRQEATEPITVLHFEHLNMNSVCSLCDKSLWMQGHANKGYLYHPDPIQMIHHLIPLQTLTECIEYATIMRYFLSTVLFSALNSLQLKQLDFCVHNITYPELPRKEEDAEASGLDDERIEMQEENENRNATTTLENTLLCGFTSIPTTSSSFVGSLPSSSLSLITYEMTD